MSKSFYLFIAALVIATGCKTSQKAAASTAADTYVMSGAFRKPLSDKELFAQTRESIGIDTVYISRDTLHVLTKKVQSCDVDNFKLVWNGMLKKSLPPQADFRLFLLGEPTCKEQHLYHLEFNLAPVRYKGDSISKGTTMLKVGGYKYSLRYDF